MSKFWKENYRGCLCNLSRVVYHIPHWDVTMQVYLINCKSEKTCDINDFNLNFFLIVLQKNTIQWNALCLYEQ